MSRLLHLQQAHYLLNVWQQFCSAVRKHSELPAFR